MSLLWKLVIVEVADKCSETRELFRNVDKWEHLPLEAVTVHW
jgi:hypothetical protein